jgi:S1-C subfamily serine protease
LKKGDRLLTMDGRWTDSRKDVYEIASHLKAGVTVPLHVKRGDKEVTLQIKPRSGL